MVVWFCSVEFDGQGKDTGGEEGGESVFILNLIIEGKMKKRGVKYKF